MNFFMIEEGKCDNLCIIPDDNHPPNWNLEMAFTGNFPFRDGCIKPYKYKAYIFFKVAEIIYDDGYKCSGVSFAVSNYFNNKEHIYAFFIGLRKITVNGFSVLDTCIEETDFPDNEFCYDDRSKYIALYAYNHFDLIQSEALKSHKKVIQCKKYEKRAIEKDIKTQDIKEISIGGGVTYYPRAESDEIRKYIRHCEAWGVRGHYRHYKSGKTIFIKPFTKGAGESKKTIYKIQED